MYHDVPNALAENQSATFTDFIKLGNFHGFRILVNILAIVKLRKYSHVLSVLLAHFLDTKRVELIYTELINLIQFDSFSHHMLPALSRFVVKTVDTVMTGNGADIPQRVMIAETSLKLVRHTEELITR